MLIASIVTILKSIAEILGLGKFIYNEVKETPIEKQIKVEAKIQEEEEKAKKTGRPSWD